MMTKAKGPIIEWPLFDAKGCPTMRYVGGTSKFLCECPNPRTCEGVQNAMKKYPNYKPGRAHLPSNPRRRK